MSHVMLQSVQVENIKTWAEDYLINLRSKAPPGQVSSIKQVIMIMMMMMIMIMMMMMMMMIIIIIIIIIQTCLYRIAASVLRRKLLSMQVLLKNK